MNDSRLSHFFILILLIGLLTTIGCSRSRSASLYRLNAVKNTSAGQAIDLGIIGIGPVEAVETLNRPQIVINLSANLLNASEYNKWGEPVAEGFSRILVDNITALTGSSKIIPQTWMEHTRLSFQVLVNDLDLQCMFDDRGAGTARLKAGWCIFNDEGTIVSMHRFDASQPISSPQSMFSSDQQKDAYLELVEAWSMLTGKFCEEMVTILTQLSQQTPSPGTTH